MKKLLLLLSIFALIAVLGSCTKVVPEKLDKDTRSPEDSSSVVNNGIGIQIENDGAWRDTIYV